MEWTDSIDDSSVEMGPVILVVGKDVTSMNKNTVRLMPAQSQNAKSYP
jgi:hypothetical protein